MEVFKLFGTLGLNGVKETQNQLDNVTNQAENSSNTIVSAFKKIGGVIATAFALDKIKNFGVAAVNAAAEIQAEEAAFTQIMGKYADEATNKVSKIAEATGIVDSRLTPYMTSMTAKFKGLGYDVEEATDLASTGLNIAADAAAFWDKSLEDSMGALNSFVNGNYEGGEAIGLFANETTLANWASENLNLTWKELTEKEKQFARLEFAKAMQEASGAVGQAKNESGAYANVMGNLSEAWRQFKSNVGEPILQNIVIPAMQWLGTFINDTLIPGFQNLKQYIIEHKDQLIGYAQNIGIATVAILGLVGALKTGLIIQQIVQGFQNAKLQLALYTMQSNGASIAQGFLNGQLTLGETIVGLLTGKIKLSTLATTLWTKAQTALNVVLSANPIALIVLAIAALVAALVVVYQKNETFRKAVNNLWNEIKNGLIPIFNSLKPVLDAIINLFKNIWSLIQSIVIPIFKTFVSVITSIVNIITPILSTLLKAFNACFKPVIAVVTTVINIIGGIVDVITKAVNAVKNGINKIKGFFNFKFKWPELKMPKFGISPEGWKVGDLLKGKIPKLSIKWNAEGAIFDEPTIFPTAYGLQGAGEAGPEAIAPIDKLTGYVENAVKNEMDGLSYLFEKLINMLAIFFPQILEKMEFDIVLQDGVLVGKLAPKINIKLAEIQKANERGR